MKSERLEPEDSVEWAHATHRVSSVYLHTFLISMLFVCISLYFFSTEFIVSHDNYGQLARAMRAELTNVTEISLDEVILSMDPQHPLHKILERDILRHTFGTVFDNHCTLFPYPNGTNLPSLLHRMTFSAPTQAAMRTAVLISIGIRMITTLIRNADILQQNSDKTRLHHIKFLLCLCCVSDMTTSVFGMLVTCLHATIDEKSMAFLVHYSLPMFGISFLVYGITYTLLEYYDINRKTSRVLERVFCLSLFALCLPLVSTNYVSFLLSKPCLYHVNWLTALAEYTCIASILVFYLSQVDDYALMQVVLSTEKVETMCCMEYVDLPDYKPAMLHDFHSIIEKQKREEEQRRHKSVIFVF